MWFIYYVVAMMFVAYFIMMVGNYIDSSIFKSEKERDQYIQQASGPGKLYCLDCRGLDRHVWEVTKWPDDYATPITDEMREKYGYGKDTNDYRFYVKGLPPKED